MNSKIYFGDNLEVLNELPSESIDLIYIDPPFNTGKVQGRTQIKTIRSEEGDRNGFQGERYVTIKLGTKSYSDTFVQAGKEANVSAFHLVSRVIQEQGVKGQSGTINMDGGDGQRYFNFFNFGAGGSGNGAIIANVVNTMGKADN